MGTYREQKFAGKVALITGAASGIGKATAELLAAQGAQIMLADINEQGLADTLARIEGQGGSARTVVFDAMQETDCVRIVNDTVQQYGKLDILGNIAGIVSMYHLHEITAALWQKFMAINLNAPMFLSREAMPHLLESAGCIVNISSTAGVGGQAYNTPYVATKHAVLGMTKSLALEFAKRNVRVNAICPGGVQTPLNDTIRWPEDIDQALVQRLFPVMDSMATAEQIAAVFAFLCSEEAQFVTGAGWVIDGGQTI